MDEVGEKEGMGDFGEMGGAVALLSGPEHHPMVVSKQRDSSSPPAVYPQTVLLCPLELLLPAGPGGSDRLTPYLDGRGWLRVRGSASAMKKFKIIDLSGDAAAGGGSLKAQKTSSLITAGQSGRASPQALDAQLSKALDVQLFLDDGSAQLEVALSSGLAEQFLGMTAAQVDAHFDSEHKSERRAELCLRFGSFQGLFWASRSRVRSSSKAKAKQMVTLHCRAEDDIRALCAQMLRGEV